MTTRRRPQGGDDRMAVDTSIIGKPTTAKRVRVERGPVAAFVATR